MTLSTKAESLHSHINSGKMSAQQLKVLQRLVKHGPDFRYSIALNTGLSESSVCARLDELQRGDYVHVSHIAMNPKTGRRNNVYRATAKGELHAP